MLLEGFPNWPPSWSTLLFVPALLIGFTVHELAHAVVAFLLGDASQVERKRLTFNPLRHVSWVGMGVFLLFGFGWAKPVRVNPARFRIRNRAFGMFLVSVAGSVANFLLFLAAVLAQAGVVMVVSLLLDVSVGELYTFFADTDPALDLQGVVTALTTYVAQVNLILAVFNLLPVPPLDGFQAVVSLYAAVRGGLTGADAARPAFRQLSATDVDREHEPELSPAQIHFDIGLEYHKKGQYDEAIARYRQATAHDETFALAYYNQGLAYLAKDRRSLAASAFRAVLQSGGEPGLRFQADLRLRELARVEQDPALEPGPVPPPLEPSRMSNLPGDEPASLDPALVRQVWLRLGVGAGFMLILAVVVWLFVLGVTLQAMM